MFDVADDRDAELHSPLCLDREQVPAWDARRPFAAFNAVRRRSDARGARACVAHHEDVHLHRLSVKIVTMMLSPLARGHVHV